MVDMNFRPVNPGLLSPVEELLWGLICRRGSLTGE